MDERTGQVRLPKSRTTGITLVALVVLMAAAAWFGRDDGGNSTTSPDGDRISELNERILTPIPIRYEVTGTAQSVDITFTTPTGIQQNADTAVPLLVDGDDGLLVEFDRGAFVSISAQNADTTGSVTCIITNDGTGEELARNTSSGAYVIASCDATAR